VLTTLILTHVVNRSKSIIYGRVTRLAMPAHLDRSSFFMFRADHEETAGSQDHGDADASNCHPAHDSARVIRWRWIRVCPDLAHGAADRAQADCSSSWCRPLGWGRCKRLRVGGRSSANVVHSHW